MKDDINGDFSSSRGSSIYHFTKFVALIGGGAVVMVAAITVISVIGRYAFDTPVTGDYEIVEYGISAAAFFFFAFAHASNSHIIAEFFSSQMSPKTRQLIDLVQNLILFIVLLFLVWRIAIGGIDKFETGDESMLLEMKTWWLHLIGVFRLRLFAWVAFLKMFRRH